jgi:hypothetical protein
MHKISLLSDVYDVCWKFLNDKLLCSYLFFHDIFPLPPFLSLIHYFLTNAIALCFSILENLSDFYLSSTSHCLFCNSPILFLGLSWSLLRFLVPLCSCAHLILSMHYQH